MKQLIPLLAALALGIAVGVGIGKMSSKTKVNESRMKIEELQTQIETSKAESEQTIKKATEEIARTKRDLSRNQTVMREVNAELIRLKAELAKMKTRDLQSAAAALAETTEPSSASKTPAAGAMVIPTTDYTVKDGDSLWKIAEEQLGNGLRLKEILELNPGISETKPLIIGTKLKIPSK